MEEALYGDGGYYRRGRLPIGEAGDYVTGSSFSSLFGRATARLLRRLDGPLGAGGRPADFFEAAYGNGTHLAAVAAALGREPPRRILGWDRVPRPLPVETAAEVETIAELAAVAEGEIHGLVFSYELFDALPVHRLVGRRGGQVGELYAALDGEKGEWTWQEGELSAPHLRDLLGGIEIAPGQVADLAPGWASLYRALARRLGRGLLITCDYGFERPSLLDPRIRHHGTLACYTGQRVHRNPFVRIGTQDLTAHVDFTALRETGEAEGLATVAFTRQALWLTACGLFADLAGADLATRREALALLDGEGMGQEIRVLVQARGLEAAEVLDPRLLAHPGSGSFAGG